MLLQLESVSKIFSGRPSIEALSDVSLSLESGEFVSIVGPSGCGKSTLFNLIAGVETLSSGRIVLDQTEEAALRRQKVGYLFQKDLLLPWRNVLANATLGLEVEGRLSKAEARARARQLLPRFGLEGFETNRPAALSGGMRQRLALLRTLLLERPLLLLDEPFASLDALTRRELQVWLADAWQLGSEGALLVTHDVQEAVALSNRICLFGPRPGHVIAEFPVRRPGEPRPPLQALANLEQEILSAMGLRLVG